MSITAHAAPIVAFQDPVANANPELAPSLFIQGSGVLDPRPFYTYNPGQNFGALTAGFNGVSRLTTLNVIPYTATVNLIAAAQHITSGTALTLASATANGIGVGASVTRADTGAVVSGLLEIDPPVAQCTATIAAGTTVMTVTALAAPGADSYNTLSHGMVLSGTSVVTGTTIIGGAWNGLGTGNGGLGTYAISTAPSAAITNGTITAKGIGTTNLIPFGSVGTIQLWNPAKLLSRVLVITASNASAATTTFTVNGLDCYGYGMTEQITVTPGSAVATDGLKAWKYISSITPNATDGTYNFEVGTIDTIGLPLRSDTFQVGIEADTSLMFNNAAIAATTGYTAAVLTTATATTGDVRGTYALQTSSNGTLRLVASQTPPLAALGSSAGLFGVPQYTAW